jgi:DNA-binding NarL/FixJ family response regulator
VRVGISHPMRTWVQSLGTLLGPWREVEVVATCTNPKWLRPAVMAGEADVVLVYIGESFDDVSPVLSEMFAANPSLGVVVLTENDQPAFLMSAIREGVRGWVEPTASVDHLVRVLVGVSAGESWFPPPVLTGALDGLLAAARSHQDAATVLENLSAREAEVLRCLAQGLNRQQIAQRYSLSPHTVRTHVNNLLHKLDVHSTLAAVSLARQLGLVEEVDARSAPSRHGRAGPW